MVQNPCFICGNLYIKTAALVVYMIVEGILLICVFHCPRSPWAPTRRDEDEHRALMKELGSSFLKNKEIMFLLYLLSIIAMTDEEYEELHLPEEGRMLMREKENYVRRILKRYLKTSFGVKVGMTYYLTAIKNLSIAKVIIINNTYIYSHQ